MDGRLSAPPIWATYAVAVTVLLTCFLLYWPAVQFGFVNIDDGLYVTDNRHVQAGLTLNGLAWAFTTGEAGLWIPLAWLSHMLDCQLYGLDPWGHHLTNIVLHSGSTMLLFLAFFR